MNETYLIAIILIIILLCYLYKRREGYDSINSYYNHRAWTYEPCDYKKLTQYPYNYQPYEHPERIAYYYPQFFKYGYGNL
jgi:hypothetical protein